MHNKKEDSFADDGEHTENSNWYQECKLSCKRVPVSFGIILPLEL